MSSTRDMIGQGGHGVRMHSVRTHVLSSHVPEMGQHRRPLGGGLTAVTL